MGAIAVSKAEELQIERLRRELRIPTKSAVIRKALWTLENKIDQERLRREVEESVHRCRSADRLENRELLPAAVARRTSRS